MVDPNDLEKAIRPETVLITMRHANNEVGFIQPIQQVCEIASRLQIVVHFDCAQSVGKIPVNVDYLGVDLVSIAGHKVYVPIGIGAVYIRYGI